MTYVPKSKRKQFEAAKKENIDAQIKEAEEVTQSLSATLEGLEKITQQLLKLSKLGEMPSMADILLDVGTAKINLEKLKSDWETHFENLQEMKRTWEAEV